MENQTQTVIVTGAAGGIGRATCERLANKGWQVLAVDRDGDKLQWAVNKENIHSQTADITSEQCNLDMIATAERIFGGIDAVILNAAIPMGGSIEQVSMDHFELTMKVNVLGTALGIRAALPALRRRGGGSIVVTASAHGLAGEADNAAYVASKHAVVGLVKSTARDVGCEGIRINAICPGLTRQTGMTSMLEDPDSPPAAFELLSSNIPLQRAAEPDEMASVMEFLISPGASYINGAAIPVDGGAISGSGLLPPRQKSAV